MDNLAVGKLYYYDKPDKNQISFEEKLKILLAEHKDRYPWNISTCLIHPDTLGKEILQDQDIVLGVKIVFYQGMMKDYFWFLQENKAEK